jgi:KDO2-lipid IV(A) lauroyltransferase
MLKATRVLARLPLRVLHLFGAVIGWAAYCLSGSYRRKFQTNWSLAHRLMGANDLGLQAKRRRAIAEAGKLVAELPFVWFRPVNEIGRLVTVSGWEHVEGARRQAKGVLFLTPHLGCFEVSARYYALTGPITVLYKPARQVKLEELSRAARAIPNLSAVPANKSGIRQLLRALKKGEAVGLLPDQVPSEGEGEWVPFFGQPAYSMTLPAKLAQLTGAPILLAAVERLPSGRGWHLRIEPMLADPTTESVNQAMETLVKRRPDQYLWGYNRYKPSGPRA